MPDRPPSPFPTQRHNVRYPVAAAPQRRESCQCGIVRDRWLASVIRGGRSRPGPCRVATMGRSSCFGCSPLGDALFTGLAECPLPAGGCFRFLNGRYMP